MSNSNPNTSPDNHDQSNDNEEDMKWNEQPMQLNTPFTNDHESDDPGSTPPSTSNIETFIEPVLQKTKHPMIHNLSVCVICIQRFCILSVNL